MKKWADVEQSKEFQALPQDQKEVARNQYFSEIIAPQIPEEQRASAKTQFDAETSGYIHSAEEYEAPKVKTEKKPRTLAQEAGSVAKSALQMGASLTPFATKKAEPLGEVGLSMATGMGASIVGGARGIASIISGEGPEEAARKVRETQEALTYTPRTEGGQKLARGLAVPMELASKYAGKAGGAIGEAVAGEKGRIAGESLGEVAPEIGLTVAPIPKMTGRALGKIPSRAEQVVAAEPKRELTPVQQERFERQKAQGLKPTLASVTREPEHFRFEEQTAQTPAGKVLFERQRENEKAIIDAVKGIDREKTAETKLKPAAETELETGMSVTNALKKKEESAWKEVNTLYERAKEAGETNVVISAKPLEDWLNKNRSEAISVPALGSIVSKLEQMKGEYKGNLTVGDMEEIYKTASRLSKPGDPSSFYMGKVKSLINQVTAGKGGDLYREARRARLKYGKEFEDQKSIADLIGTKRGYPADPQVAAERVFERAVLSKSSSLQDLQNIGRTLTTGDIKSFPEGPQAMRELQSQTINHLIEKSNVGTTDAPRLSQAAFKREIRKIGKDKLNFLLGKDSVKKLNDVLRTMEETQVKPGRVTSSETYLNFKMEAQRVAKEEGLHAIASMSRITGAAAKIFKGRKEAKAVARGVEEAMEPTRATAEQTKKAAQEARKLKRKYRMEEAMPAPVAAAGAAAGLEASQQEQARRPMQEGF